MKILKIFYFLTFIGLFFTLSTQYTTIYAKTTTSTSFTPSTTKIGYISETCGFFKISGCKDVFEIIFGAVIPTLYVVIFALSAIFFLVGAIKLVTSAGNSEQVKAAWGQIQSNFVGLIVLLLSVTIFFVVISLVGIGFSFASDITNIK